MTRTVRLVSSYAHWTSWFVQPVVGVGASPLSSPRERAQFFGAKRSNNRMRSQSARWEKGERCGVVPREDVGMGDRVWSERRRHASGGARRFERTGWPVLNQAP